VTQANEREGHTAEESMRNLAYAAFHCSSLRDLAASTSDCEMKREPTMPVEMEGRASSAIMTTVMMMVF
jgi:hypothetical protein